uniref:Uncharacterized protein n=1 Tax=Ciona intestinalis TaxID=7719 RepID=H2XJF6_CIOIN
MKVITIKRRFLQRLNCIWRVFKLPFCLVFNKDNFERSYTVKCKLKQRVHKIIF